MYFSQAHQSRSQYKNGKFKYRTYKIRTPALKEFQAKMAEKLESCIPDNVITEFKNFRDKGYYGLCLFSVIYMPMENYESSDSSNYIKAYEDSIAKRLGIDDVDNLTVRMTKKLSTDSNWGIQTNLSVELRDQMYLARKLKIIKKEDLDRMEKSEKYYCSVCGHEYNQIPSFCEECHSNFED
jgi:hypothetical protein